MVLKVLANKIFWILVHHSRGERKNELLRKICAHIGKNSEIFSENMGAEPYLVWIGDNVIVAGGVKFITHDASYWTVSRYMGERSYVAGEKMGHIVLKDNCFIGGNSLLLPGTIVGENSVIAAGSVVNTEIPPNQVWGGVPAKYIMPLEVYADKIRKYEKTLPWMDEVYEGKQFTNEQLVEFRKKHFLKEYTNDK